MKLSLQHFFDARTSTLTYVVIDEETSDCVVIDPVLDFDMPSGKIWHESFDQVYNFISEKKLNLKYVLETHAHADHLSSSQLFKENFAGVKVGIGERIKIVQSRFKPYFDLKELKTDGSQFESLFYDNEVFSAGSIQIAVIFTPGHTPACLTYHIGPFLFTGDAIFMPDSGTGRCDFPDGDARQLYRSITERIYSLPDETMIFVGHDYQPNGRELAFRTTVGEQKKRNIQIKGDSTEAEFVEFRTARDKTLTAPKLLLPSVQVNIDGGRLPEKKSNETIQYLKIPLKLNS